MALYLTFPIYIYGVMYMHRNNSAFTFNLTPSVISYHQEVVEILWLSYI